MNNEEIKKLEEEKANIQALNEDYKGRIDTLNTSIYWNKKRLKLIDQQLKAFKESTKYLGEAQRGVAE